MKTGPDNQKSTIEKKEYISTLEQLMAFITLNVRRPIAFIKELPYLDGTPNNSPLQINRKIVQIKQLALLLENRIRELSVLIFKKVIKLKG